MRKSEANPLLYTLNGTHHSWLAENKALVIRSNHRHDSPVASTQSQYLRVIYNATFER